MQFKPFREQFFRGFWRKLGFRGDSLFYWKIGAIFDGSRRVFSDKNRLSSVFISSSLLITSGFAKIFFFEGQNLIPARPFCFEYWFLLIFRHSVPSLPKRQPRDAILSLSSLSAKHESRSCVLPEKLYIRQKEIHSSEQNFTFSLCETIKISGSNSGELPGLQQPHSGELLWGLHTIHNGGFFWIFQRDPFPANRADNLLRNRQPNHVFRASEF